MSASHIEPDIGAEIFVLDGRPDLSLEVADQLIEPDPAYRG